MWLWQVHMCTTCHAPFILLHSRSGCGRQPVLDTVLRPPSATAAKAPASPTRHSSLYIGLGVSAGIICTGSVLAWLLVRRIRGRAALQQQLEGPSWRKPGALPVGYGSDAASRQLTSEDRV
jgi:hypothetical protein